MTSTQRRTPYCSWRTSHFWSSFLRRIMTACVLFGFRSRSVVEYSDENWVRWTKETLCSSLMRAAAFDVVACNSLVVSASVEDLASAIESWAEPETL